MSTLVRIPDKPPGVDDEQGWEVALNVETGEFSLNGEPMQSVVVEDPDEDNA